MGPEIVFVAIIAYIGFMQWLRHQRRAMVHRERLAAIEKGASLPEIPASPDEELHRRWNVQRLLLLAGLVARRRRDPPGLRVDRPGSGDDRPVAPRRLRRGP
jgi:hypothetical protein